jgi:hypothetical protein
MNVGRSIHPEYEYEQQSRWFVGIKTAEMFYEFVGDGPKTKAEQEARKLVEEAEPGCEIVDVFSCRLS